MPTRLSPRIVDAGLPPEVAGRVAECGKYDTLLQAGNRGPVPRPVKQAIELQRAGFG